MIIVFKYDLDIQMAYRDLRISITRTGDTLFNWSLLSLKTQLMNSMFSVLHRDQNEYLCRCKIVTLLLERFISLGYMIETYEHRDIYHLR